MTIENCAMGSSLMFVTRPASQLATMGFSEHKVETYWLLMLCCHSLSDIHCWLSMSYYPKYGICM